MRCGSDRSPAHARMSNVATVKNQLPGITSFSRSLPAGRIHQFMRVAGHDAVRAQALHDWNEAIGSALFRPLQKLELALRARIPVAFENIYGPAWYQDPRFKKKSDLADRKSIAAAIQRLMAAGLSIDSDALMAKAPFGLCVGLLRPIYNPEVWSKELHRTFPALPASEGRPGLASIASHAAWLRNRIDHHEPLVDVDLSLSHSKILKALGWIDLVLAARARRDTAVQQLLRAKP